MYLETLGRAGPLEFTVLLIRSLFILTQYLIGLQVIQRPLCLACDWAFLHSIYLKNYLSRGAPSKQVTVMVYKLSAADYKAMGMKYGYCVKFLPQICPKVGKIYRDAFFKFGPKIEAALSELYAYALEQLKGIDLDKVNKKAEELHQAAQKTVRSCTRCSLLERELEAVNMKLALANQRILQLEEELALRDSNVGEQDESLSSSEDEEDYTQGFHQ